MKRNYDLLLLSLRFAKEYLNTLCQMQPKIDEIQESKELTIQHRAIWTALIIEVGKLFDTYNTKGVISFKKLPHLKNEVDRLHGEAIIGKIIDTRNTFTGHFSDQESELVSSSDICNSNLKDILDKLSNLDIKLGN